MEKSREVKKAKEAFLKRCEKALDLDACQMKFDAAYKRSKMLFKCDAQECLGLEIDGHFWNFICFIESKLNFMLNLIKIDVEAPKDDSYVIPDRKALEALFKVAEEYDVFIMGLESSSKVLSKGETPENLLIESDLRRVHTWKHETKRVVSIGILSLT